MKRLDVYVRRSIALLFILLVCQNVSAEVWTCSFSENEGIGTITLKPHGDQYEERTSIKYPGEEHSYKSTSNYKLFSESDSHLTLIYESRTSTFVFRINKKSGTFELDSVPGDAIPTRGSCVPL